MVLSRAPVTAKNYDFDGKPNQSFSAVSCSQENIATFINKIKASPWFKDTVIVVSSDHLAMNNTAWKYLNKQDRNNLFFSHPWRQAAARDAGSEA